MRLFAISDLHLSAAENRAALEAMPHFGNDWLIVAGDVAERFDHIASGFKELTRRFAKVIWAPGNHELWALRRPNDLTPLKGEARYAALVELARSFGVLTPEDPFLTWPDTARPLVLAPMFLLYDYSFRPDHISREDVRRWAREKRSACADEFYLNPAPHATREDWCAHRVALTQNRLDQLPADTETILINHYPLREDQIRLRRAPRMSPWCGTRATKDWHERYRAHSMIFGHLHTRRSALCGSTRFEEVSLGYPDQWEAERGLEAYLRQIL